MNSSGWRSLIQSVTDMDEHSTNQSDYDTPTQEESELQSMSGKAQDHTVFSRVILKRLNLYISQNFLSLFAKARDSLMATEVLRSEKHSAVREKLKGRPNGKTFKNSLTFYLLLNTKNI